jgi:hypothetical protein
MICHIDEIVAAARAGRPVIMIDAETRKNEGHLIVPAQFADAATINFMARHCRGIVALAITAERARELGLKPMVRWNESHYQMAYTVSIEARSGVSTGISAGDRAQTIRTAIDPHSGALDIVTPGPRLSDHRQRRRPDGPARTHRSRDRDLPAGRTDSRRRGLRDHGRGRIDGHARRTGRAGRRP